MEYVRHNDKIYLEDDVRRILAYVTFPKVSDSTICIEHTVVDDSLRGQGIAGKLMEQVIAVARENNLSITATCSYAKNWFEKHCEHNDIYHS